MTSLVPPGVLLVLLLAVPAVFPQSIDEIIAGAYESPEEFDQLADLSGNTIRHEMDQLLTREQAELLGILGSPLKDDPRSIRKRRKAIKASSYRWTGNVIPYSIASNVFSRSDRLQITNAINEWQQYTCLRFRQANQNDANKIYFDNGKGCYSYVGMTRTGSQKIGLAQGCRFKGVIIHEIGHAVGFHHEQNRPDRDDYVTIMKENIPTNLYYNFKKYPSSAVDTMGVPYDYGSVMHYGGRAFTMNGRETIKTKNPKDQNKIGNRKGLSFNDIWLANLMYKCNERCDQRIRCPRGAFLGKDCKCLCPGYPVRECESTGTLPTTTTGPTVTTTPMKCADRNRNCPGWAKASAGYCNTNTYVRTYCKMSCGLCSKVQPTTVAYCKDLRPRSCEYWGQNGFCSGDFERFMSRTCPKTCKICGSDTKDPGEQDTTDPNSAGIVHVSLIATISSLILMTLTNLF